MEANGVFRSEGDMEINGRYSFKSLLLDGEGMDDVGMSGAHQLVLSGDLDGVEETLYRDGVMGGRESFKSLLLDDDNMEEDEIEFSAGDQTVGNDDHVQSFVLPPTAPAVGLGSQEVVSFSKDNQGVDCVCVDRQAVDYIDQELVDFVEMAHLKGTKAPPRKKRRGNGCIPAIEGGKTVSESSLDRLMGEGCNAMHGPQVGSQPQPSRSVPQGQGVRLLPLSKKKQVEIVNTQPPSRKRKQGATSNDVQKLLGSVIARQEIFFADLLESMERKEAIRERIREEKEEKWRAEERAQLGVFNNAMLALTQELLADSKSGNQLMDKAK